MKTPTTEHKYCVFVQGKSAPAKFHASAEDAVTEASRLIHEAQGRRAYVMQVLYTCDINVEVNTL